ncbi:uncharacterized protein LOC128552908, partial [Mercenaria mercenaria]|uniref:uncharacterized protein LOC128552908 n=1 Tax=Mercenaria mercenaria TaxID=6596 RepID=UPI00234F8875
VLDMINYHIHKGEDPNKIKSTETEKTVLHYAAEHQYNTVAETLLEQEMNGLAKDISKKTALGLAIRNKSDDTSAVIARNMKPLELRILFGTMWEGDQNEKQVGKEFNLNEELLKNDCDFTETIRVVFDSLQKPSKNGPDQYDVKPLIEDDQGRMPDACDFNYSHQTGFQNIAEKGLKNVVSHPMFRLLINYKWKTWARRNIARNFVLHILSLISLTVTVALAGTASDVKAYDTSSQRARAFFEVVLFCFVIKTILLEIFQVVRHGFKIYFKERLNWLDLASALLLVIVIPVRYINIEAHWYIFALAYLLWVIKVFKYVVLFR